MEEGSYRSLPVQKPQLRERGRGKGGCEVRPRVRVYGQPESVVALKPK